MEATCLRGWTELTQDLQRGNMKIKEDKKVGISSEHKEALAALGARPEFKALEALLKINKNNAVAAAFKISSQDPQLAVKKAAYEGQVFMIKMLLWTFEEARKKKEE